MYICVRVCVCACGDQADGYRPPAHRLRPLRRQGVFFCVAAALRFDKVLCVSVWHTGILPHKPRAPPPGPHARVCSET
jgi:hypothetical protein